MLREIVLATHNPHKVVEFQEILGAAAPGIVVLPYDGPEPSEDGTSFGDNALIKARAAARHTDRVALADDSGLAVEVMGGAPGIFSARWAGRAANDERNRELLLEQLADIRDPHRCAQFVCAIAVVVPGRDEKIFLGQWPGKIALTARGDAGFGYDSIFIPDGATITAAEMNPGEKNAHSHRARAVTALHPYIQQLNNRVP
ncbi:MAG: non-canonical purine NTP pyrophosphatase, RdgB/HAM1 family [Candidatus Lumbricidophila eiseniae]|uniref:dITP/XTP pyrophosphatase n=1 Tax=Candidatus Lumbricidiphila eiseniae TaxID=1969409 RepID=A0A2A6FQB9_9MICO|nr:MAG: non-canonical purine NTP pyrophosphatase, RdgB/HAM1 family [Candidatus Lumbricidophila eiseniae]